MGQLTMAHTEGRPRHLGIRAGLVAALVLGSVSVAFSAPSTVAQSWFDQPLPSSHVQLGPVAIRAHATSPGGVDAVELTIDGTVFELQQFPSLPRLAMANFAWQPLEERGYWLVVRGRSGQQWGKAAAIYVIVGDPQPRDTATPSLAPSTSPSGASGSPPPSASPTAQPTATPTAQPTSATAQPTATPTRAPTPKPTASPTATPTRKPTPTPACTLAEPLLIAPENGHVFDYPDFEQLVLLWEYLGDCPPHGFRVQVTDELGNVVKKTSSDPFFYQWEPGPDQLVDCRHYSWRVRAKGSGNSLGPWSDEWTFELSWGQCDRTDV